MLVEIGTDHRWTLKDPYGDAHAEGYDEDCTKRNMLAIERSYIRVRQGRDRRWAAAPSLNLCSPMMNG